MKKYICLFLIQLCIISVYAQDNAEYSAILLNLSGKGKLSRADESLELQMPQSYIGGDELSVQNGSVLIMLYSGEEISLNEDSKYIIPAGVVIKSSEIKELAKGEGVSHGLLAQAGAAYSIRGKSSVFPVKSKILKPQNTLLRFKYGKVKDFKLTLKIIDNTTQKVLFEDKAVKDTIYSLANVPFEEGKSYYYTISDAPDGKSAMGLLVYPGSIERDNVAEYKELETNLEYINAITYYYRNNYFFEAYSLIKQAEKKYPNLDIYTVFMNNILTE